MGTIANRSRKEQGIYRHGVASKIGGVHSFHEGGYGEGRKREQASSARVGTRDR